MKRTMSAILVLGLLAAGLVVHAVRAHGASDAPGVTAAPGDDPADGGPMMAPDDMGGGGMGPGGTGRGGWGRGMGHGGWGMRRGGFGANLARELDLTPQQIEKMKASRDAQARKAIQARADIQIAQLDLHKLMQVDKPDSKAIEAQIDKIASLRAGMAKSRVTAMLDFRASLTPDQQKKLQELREKGPEMRNRGSGSQKKGGSDM
jgi:Spy/CpxP family protein refolding chaperone